MADESIRLIPLGKSGKFAIVDADDYDRLMKIKWYPHRKGHVERAPTVAMKRGEDYPSVLMHRYIMNAPPEVQVDHRNGIKHDNRKSNLRFCTNSQNQMNVPKHYSASSKFKGVSHHKGTGRWVAYMMVDKKLKHLGMFDDELEAARAYDAHAKIQYGEFAKLNFPC